jgi:hypothetical protein
LEGAVSPKSKPICAGPELKCSSIAIPECPIEMVASRAALLQGVMHRRE